MTDTDTIPTRTRTPAAASAGTMVLLHAGRTLRGWARTPAILGSAVGMPVMMLAIVTMMFGRSIESATGQSPLDGLVPLMLCTGPMFGGAASAAALVTERGSGLLTRFRTLPGPRTAPLLGRIVAEVARGVLGAVLVLATGLLLGYRIDTGIAGVLGLLGLAGLVALAFGGVMTWIGTIARTPESTVAVAPVLMILMFFNSGFMPATGFPDYLRGFVEANPLSAVVAAMTAAATGDGSVTAGLLWIGGITVAAVVLLMVSVRRRPL